MKTTTKSILSREEIAAMGAPETFPHDFVTPQDLASVRFHLHDALARLAELSAAMDNGDAAGAHYLLGCAKSRAAYVAEKLSEFSKK